MQHTQFQIQGQDVRPIYHMIKREFGQGNEYVSPSGSTYFFVFENFSFMQNSDMSVTVLVDIWNPGCCVIKLVVSGGKSGLFRLDIFGREGSRLSNIQQGFQRIATMNNWQIVPYSPGAPAPGPAPQPGPPANQ